MLKRIREIWEKRPRPLRALWRWAKDPEQRDRRYQRWLALAEWANRRRKAAPQPSKKRADWRRAQEEYSKRADANKPKPPKPEWPSGSFVELLYHDPPHLHIASADRDFLIAICKKLISEFGVMVTEFPPFEPTGTVEPVHVSGSWHYRDSSNPWTARTFANRGNGLAADINGTREYEAYQALRARYG